MGAILYLVPVRAVQILYPDCDLKTMSTFHGILSGNKHGDPWFFFWYLHVLRTVQYKTFVKKKKSLIVEHDFLWKIFLYLVYLGQGEDFNLTTELSGKVQYTHNQAIKNGLNEAILLIWIKGALFST